MNYLDNLRYCKKSGRNLLTVLMAFTASGYIQASTLESQILSFEQPSQPSWISADNSQLSSLRAIHGTQSLLWQWQQGQTLTINHQFDRLTDSKATSAYGRSATQVLSFWLYNPTAIDTTLTLELADSNQQQPSSLDINLDFTGWRAVGVSLNQDLQPAVTSNLATLTFRAPNIPNITSGSLYIDRVMLSVDDSRYQWSDDQVTTRHALPEIDFGLSEQLSAPTLSELNDAEQIKQNLIAEFGGNPGSLSSLEDRFNQFAITKNMDGVISGRHILTDKQQVIYQPAHLSPEDKVLFEQYVILGDSDSKGGGTANKLTGYAQLMLDISKAYHQPEFSADRARLIEMYILMTEHLLDQGFSDGSALVTTHHWGYSSRWWYISALMMADELANKQLLQPTYQALLWFSREFKDSFDMALNSASSNLDYFNTLSRQHLALLLLNPNDSERIALLHKFASFFSGAISQTPPGTNDGFRSDGTAWRHNGHYPGYAFSAFENAAHVAYLLKRTRFSLDNKALDKLKTVMVAGWYYTNPYVPLALSGRHPFTNLSVKRYSDGMRWLANSYPSTDEELAAIYLQVTKSSEQQSKTLFGKVIKPASLPEGSRSFNGGAFAIHRSGNRMAVIKGYNQDVWSSEIYTNDNRYGRYQSHGSVHVIPYGDPTQFGYRQDGWDWNRNPGTTTINLDYDQLESPKTATLTLRSDEGISGATSLMDKYSLFTFKHKAPQNLSNFESTFTAQKQVLASKDKLFLTGNGISNADGNNRTETTLFQLAINNQSQGVWINGRQYTQVNYSTTLTSGDWLIDDNGVGYYLINAPQVNVYRGDQVSRHNKTKKVTSGQFSSAWIDHGLAPNNAEYSYVIIMKTSPAEMADFARKMKETPQFASLETSANGQLLHDSESSLYGYSSFSRKSFTQGPVRSISTSALVLAQLDRKELDLSITSPELKIQYNDQPTVPVTISVEVAGEWDIGNATYSHQNGNTVITVESLFGQAVSLKLTQDGGNHVTVEGNGNSDGNIGEPANTGSSGGGSTNPWFIALLGLFGLLSRRR